MGTVKKANGESSSDLFIGVTLNNFILNFLS